MKVVVPKVIPLVLLLFANTVEIGSQRRSVSFFKLTHLLVDAFGTHRTDGDWVLVSRLLILSTLVMFTQTIWTYISKKTMTTIAIILHHLLSPHYSH